MRIPLAFTLMAGLAACAAPAPQVSRGVAAPTASFIDTDPHHWTDRRPHDYPVHGVDVSRWQGDIDWARVRASGASFAFIKATEGGDMTDPRFAENWAAARRAGLPRGAYHFFYFCRPAIEQARWFIAHVPKDPSALPPVLDVEWNNESPTCRRRPPPAEVRAEMSVFLDALTRHYGRRPLIYVPPDFYRDNQLSRLTGYPFWLRSTAGHPEAVYPGQPWAFWQYTGTGGVPGIQGPADINVFAGDRAQWLRWTAGAG